MNHEFFKVGLLLYLSIGALSFSFTILICLIMRPILCWYFKINQGIELLSEIRDLLENQNSNQKAIIKNLPEDNGRWAPTKKR